MHGRTRQQPRGRPDGPPEDGSEILLDLTMTLLRSLATWSLLPVSIGRLARPSGRVVFSPATLPEFLLFRREVS